MSEVVASEVRLSLTGPRRLPLAVVLRESPSFDAPRGFFTVSLRNEAGREKTLPLPELRRNVVLKYRNPATNAELVDNKTPPRRMDGAVESLGPGGIKSFQVVFEYPASIATFKDRTALLLFCVQWQSGWLRKSNYADGAYDWNESFELCHEIRIVNE